MSSDSGRQSFRSWDPKSRARATVCTVRKDVELVLEIKRLLYEKRYTIEGARKTLAGKPKKEASKVARKPHEQGQLFGGSPTLFQELRRELTEIVAFLNEPRQKK